MSRIASSTVHVMSRIVSSTVHVMSRIVSSTVHVMSRIVSSTVHVLTSRIVVCLFFGWRKVPDLMEDILNVLMVNNFDSWGGDAYE